jgi:hypothetical protein
MLAEDSMDQYERACVDNGVFELDRAVPGWQKLIDWGVLDIYSLGNCIVGQLAQHDIDVFELMGGVQAEIRFIDSYVYGFDVEEGCNYNDFEKLTDTWHDYATEHNFI